jgi:hypothetical protein
MNARQNLGKIRAAWRRRTAERGADRRNVIEGRLAVDIARDRMRGTFPTMR